MPDQQTTSIPEVVRETISAPYTFTEAEQLELGNRLVQSLVAQDQIQRELDSVKQEFKARTEKAALETNVIRRKLGDGYEMRPTLARVIFNSPSQGRKQFVRDDNGELIREEAMTLADLERPLFKDWDKEVAAVFGEDVSIPDGANVTSRAAEAAGTVNLGDKLGEAAASSEAPKLSIMLDEPGWTAGGLRTEVRVKAKKAKWAETQIQLLLDVIDGCGGDLEKVKDSIRPHVVAPSED